MEITKVELKILIKEFLTASNRVLRAGFEIYCSELDKFLTFLDTHQLISDYIQSCGESEFDVEQEYAEVSKYGNALFELGSTPENEVANIYAVLKCMVSHNVSGRDFVFYGYSDSKKYQDKVNGFGNEYIRVLISHIDNYLTRISIQMGIDETMVIDHITYDMTSGTYDNDIFTAEKSSQSIDKAFKATKAIQDYVFTDGSAVDSVEKRFATALDAAAEVCVYAKLPRGFAIPTPVGNYSPDWAIAFNEGTVKHIFFVAETKGSMDTMTFNHISSLEKAKIDCAKVLFRQLNNGAVKYDVVDSYQSLLNLMIGQ